MEILVGRLGKLSKLFNRELVDVYAARFRGPTEAFNHFAQDANFNRGRYRVLEEEWARDKRAGRAVTVKIVPRFDGRSVRPSVIDVWWTVDGSEKSVKLPNERSERSRGK